MKDDRMRVALSPSPAVYRALNGLSVVMGVPVAQVAYQALIQGLPAMVAAARAVPELHGVCIHAARMTKEYMDELESKG